MLLEACRQTVEWERLGFFVPRIAVNLSAQQIENGHLIEHVSAVLRETGLAAERLELEVTESSIMRQPEKASQAMAEFQIMGVNMAVDDFGTGYSSLAYLKRLPLDRLKIDRSFVEDIGKDASDEAICRAIIQLARSLGLETVAEGIEAPEQAEFLRREGCNIGQGYWHGRPEPADRLMNSCAQSEAGHSLSG